jgi:hypothetical protein
MHTTSVTVPGVGETPPDAKPVRETLHTEHMSDRWTYHAFRLSHDGQTNVIHRREGVVIHKANGTKTKIDMDLMQHNPRDWMWGPNSRRIIFWAPVDDNAGLGKRVAILDTGRLSGSEPWEVIYDPEDHWQDDPLAHIPFGLEWSPKGNAVYVAERLFPKPQPGKIVADGLISSALIRLDLQGTKVTKVTEIARIDLQMDFFMPPVSRFENGQGPTKKGYWIVFGAPDGLYLVDPKGKTKPRRISALPATGLYNIEWNPKANQLALYFMRPSAGSGGKIFRGVWLAHLDRIGHEEEMGPAFEQLYNRVDLHTLWYSPEGTYVTWSGPDEVAYRRPEDPPEKTVYIETHDPETGEFLEIRGVSWHHSERWLAYTAGTKLFLHDVEKLENYEIMSFSEEEKDFVAEPEWVGDKIVLTVFEDTVAEAREKHDKPVFDHD